MNDSYWLGPTYSFTAGDWRLEAGIGRESGRLEWLLHHAENGVETLSHSFGLGHQAIRQDLLDSLGDLPGDVAESLVDQVMAQDDPRLLAHDGMRDGLD
jgi:hypothetical protein